MADEFLTIDGDCCEKSLDPLRNQIVNILISDACKTMSFEVGNIKITGAMLRAVAMVLKDPGHKLHIKHEPRLSDRDGEYDWRNNRLKFTFTRLDPAMSKTASRKERADFDQTVASHCETVVHECTHAAIDLVRQGAMRSVNEAAAWFAGVLFLRNQGLPIAGELDFRKNLRALADDAAKANSRGQHFVMPAAAVAALRTDIVAAYKHGDFGELHDGI